MSQRRVAEVNRALAEHRAINAKRTLANDKASTENLILPALKHANDTLEKTRQTGEECMAVLSQYKTWCKDYKKLCAL